MEDKTIVDMYWRRDERALFETYNKYGKYLFGIAYRILSDNEDAEECVNDTYLAAWQSMPENRPSVLSAYLGKIVRRIAIGVFRKKTAQKRGGSEIPYVLDELEECIAGQEDVETEVERMYFRDIIQAFLMNLPQAERQVFVCRYWYIESIADIANQFGFSESKVKSMLYRAREKLRTVLEKEGY